MPRILHIILLLMLTASLTCEKKVEIELLPLEKRLVVHGYIAIGEHVSISVGKTVRDGSFGPDTYQDNALALLYENGVFADTLYFDSATRTYVSQKIIARAGVEYKIRVQVTGYPSVEATATGALVPATEGLQRIEEAQTASDGSKLDAIRFSFPDNPHETNFYLTAIYPAGYLRSLGCVFSTDPAIDKPNTSVLPFGDGDCISAGEIFFTDRSFNGQQKAMHFSAYSYDMMPKTEPDGTIQRAYMKRYAISEAFYHYYKFTSTLYDFDELPFYTESSDAKGNIVNGYGLFTVFDVRTDTIR